VSVAFRREGDDEHLEPKFEIPIPPGRNFVTRRGMALIDARVAELSDQVAALAEAGENAAQVEAVRRDLRYWETRQITAELVPEPTGACVEIGTTVEFRQNDKLRQVTIVGDDEADPAAGLIAFSAPLARALLQAEAGERVEFAGKPEALEVVAIRVAG
jgi:transcription elongation GreA/GreB family factor